MAIHSSIMNQLNKIQTEALGKAEAKNKALEKKKEALKQFPLVVSMIDKLAKNNIIHDNKAANLKSKLSKHLGTL